MIYFEAFGCREIVAPISRLSDDCSKIKIDLPGACNAMAFDKN